ncbi:Osmosensitive K+ channel histidine kinase KdpD [Caenispirillum salinarum AK4]|uniref:histidine kinase n=1 Tax=Caenispirillum salinarum AK4 TaxID=1238182 RepID=K9HPZ3_9PROT|nr:ATP-binding protein [Caenispirillum salinarum]EKV32358.1 Osmosensitive K+ channel histidine kinase KdpD [Caenispirillum salinarum AK4]
MTTERPQDSRPAAIGAHEPPRPASPPFAAASPAADERGPRDDTGHHGPAAAAAALEEDHAGRRGRLKLFLGVAPGAATVPTVLAAHIDTIHRLRREAPDRAQRPVIGLLMPGDLRDLPAEIQDSDAMIVRCDNPDDLLRHDPDVVVIKGLRGINRQIARLDTGASSPIDAILDRGIDVYCALSAAHLDGARDRIGVLALIPREDSLPETLLEKADQIELVDAAPEDLAERFESRSLMLSDDDYETLAPIYAVDCLTLLRETAIGVTARHVHRQSLEQWSEGAGVDAETPAVEPEPPPRILVLLSDVGRPERLVQDGHRLADRNGAAWFVAYVDTAWNHRLPQAIQREVTESLHLADHLGAEVVPLGGPDLLEEVSEFIRTHRITEVVVARPPVRGLRRLWRRPFADQLLERFRNLGVHIVPGPEMTVDAFALPWRIDEGRPWFHEYLAGAVAACMAAGLIKVLDPLLPAESLSIIMLMAVVYAATAYGFASALFTSVLGLAMFNFFFVEPQFALTPDRPEQIFQLAIYLVLAAIAANLAGRLHDQAQAARRRERHTGALYHLSREIAATSDPAKVMSAISAQMRDLLNVNVMILLPRRMVAEADPGPTGSDEEAEELCAAWPEGGTLDEEAWRIASWVRRYGEPAGRGTTVHSNAGYLFQPLRTGGGVIGVLVVEAADPMILRRASFRRQLDSLAGFSAVAVERMHLNREVETVRVVAETESMRSALLSSLSHDLRTPLASIIGSTSSLLTYGRSYSEDVQRDLLKTVLEEAERLNRFVGNLLQMTKLEAGATVPKPQWTDLDDLVGTTLERMEGRLEKVHVALDIPPMLPLFQVDFVLMEHVLMNLIDNAVKYSPVGSTITIRGHAEDGWIVIEITDEGIGIPAEHCARIFDKFFRVYSRDRVVAGTGLGLAICKGIVEGHGGTIEAESDGENGSTFRVRLPVRTPTAADLEGVDAPPEHLPAD